MKTTNCLEFCSDPYVKHGFMRIDIFKNRFYFFLDLTLHLLDNDKVSSYSTEVSLYVKGMSTVYDTVRKIYSFIKSFDVNHYSQKHLHEDDHLISSHISSIRIYDRENRIVLGGKLYKKNNIHWLEPAVNNNETCEIEKK